MAETGLGRKNQRRATLRTGFGNWQRGRQAIGDDYRRRLRIEQVGEHLPEATLTNPHGPFVLGHAEHLQALRMDDVDVSDQVGPVAVGALDLDAAVGLVADMPVEQQLSRLSS